jgi:hypothetical protein
MTTAYLIEFSYFTDDDATVRLVDSDELATWLAKNFEHAYYCGDGYDVTRLFRYTDGTLTPLSVHQTGSYAADDDYLYFTYAVRPAEGPAGAAPDLTFTTCIDGRA